MVASPFKRHPANRLLLNGDGVDVLVVRVFGSAY
jgi:hypothetical protein